MAAHLWGFNVARLTSLVLLASLTSAGPALAEAGRPGSSLGPSVASSGVDVVLVHPFHGCDPQVDAWATLNQDWQQFGTTQVTIHSTAQLCANNFVLADLEASGADVVLLSCAACDLTMTQGDADALQAYAEEGHEILATSLAFGGGKHINNDLTPLFGLAQQEPWRASGDSGAPFTYRLRRTDPAAPALFAGLPRKYASTNVDRTQKPSDSHWSNNDLAGARIIGRNSDQKCVITIFQPGTYSGIFISNTPEFDSTQQDLRFLYNALTYEPSQ